jgi:hypothetical protein
MTLAATAPKPKGEVTTYESAEQRLSLILRNRPSTSGRKIRKKEPHSTAHPSRHTTNWFNMIRRALGLSTQSLAFENLPAVGRVSVSSPAVMQPLAALNRDKKYADQIKPFNFLLTCHVKQMGHPTDTDHEKFHLISPYDANPANWLRKLWVDQYTGKLYRITTSGHHGTRGTARVKTYGDVLREYELTELLAKDYKLSSSFCDSFSGITPGIGWSGAGLCLKRNRSDHRAKNLVTTLDMSTSKSRSPFTTWSAMC